MRSFRKPNLNAPRYRKKVYRTYNEEFYKKFLEKYPKYKGYTYSELKKIIWHCHDQLQKEIIENRDGIELEQSLGFMFIGTCPRTTENRDIIDYGKSIKYGVIVSHKNWETDGNIGKIFYTNYAVKYKVQDRQIWKFVACRKFTRRVKDDYPKDWTKYIVVDNRLRISKMYTGVYMKEKSLKQDKDSLNTYNEFDI
jgi:hypothetical protein